jgi:hypothetical protein
MADREHDSQSVQINCSVFEETAAMEVATTIPILACGPTLGF